MLLAVAKGCSGGLSGSRTSCRGPGGGDEGSPGGNGGKQPSCGYTQVELIEFADWGLR